MKNILLIPLALALSPGLLRAQPESTRTVRLDLLPGGTIRVEKTYGDLFLEGWDQPQIEITFTKSTATAYDSGDPQRLAKQMESVQVEAVKSAGNEISISAKAPRAARNSVGLDIHVFAPRGSKLVLRHGVGDIVVRDIGGDIDSSTERGDVTLWLPGGRTYAIDARSRAGTISSELPGSHRSHYLFGQTFVNASSGSSQRLHLRVGIGGITLKPLLPESQSPRLSAN
jgi:hypothetical protein